MSESEIDEEAIDCFADRANAVTFVCGAMAYSGTDFHRADVAPVRKHI
jgi:hypothetical protein